MNRATAEKALQKEQKNVTESNTAVDASKPKEGTGQGIRVFSKLHNTECECDIQICRMTNYELLC